MFLPWLLSNQNIKIPRSVTSRHGMPCCCITWGQWHLISTIKCSVHSGDIIWDIYVYENEVPGNWATVVILKVRVGVMQVIIGEAWSALLAWPGTLERSKPSPSLILLRTADWEPREPRAHWLLYFVVAVSVPSLGWFSIIQGCSG